MTDLALPHTHALEFELNGKNVTAAIEARELLLDLLRDRFGLTGAKRSCDVQVCGACTVLVDGIPVSACCTLAYEAQGKRVETVEGLSRHGTLHPIQRAFIDRGALQCGFCTSGMLLATKALLTEYPRPSPEIIRHELAGNLCRCTGYWNIIEAVQHAATLMSGADRETGP